MGFLMTLAQQKREYFILFFKRKVPMLLILFIDVFFVTHLDSLYVNSAKQKQKRTMTLYCYYKKERYLVGSLHNDCAQYMHA